MKISTTLLPNFFWENLEKSFQHGYIVDIYYLYVQKLLLSTKNSKGLKNIKEKKILQQIFIILKL